MKHIIQLFLRDLKVNSRDFLTLYIICVPLLLAVLINIFVPSVNDTTVNLALLSSESDQIAYFNDFAAVETFDSVDALYNRVKGRDSVIGIIPLGNTYTIVAQGNETKATLDYAKLLNALYLEGAILDESTAQIYEFGNSISPLRRILVNVTLLFSVALGGMLIALNIIEEKIDKTISAINVSPVNKFEFVMGKSLMGIISPIVGSLFAIYLTGFNMVNILMVIFIIVIATTLCIVIGFMQGLNNDDVMQAAASMKLLFLPLFLVIPVVEILEDKWEKFFYWNPFYWAYISNNAILLREATWSSLLFNGLIILLINSLIIAILVPRIRTKLN